MGSGSPEVSNRPRQRAAIAPRLALLLIALSVGPLAFLLLSLRRAGMPDFAAACQTGAPFHVAAVYRGQIDPNRPPEQQGAVGDPVPGHAGEPHPPRAGQLQAGGRDLGSGLQPAGAGGLRRHLPQARPALWAGGLGGHLPIDLRTGNITTFATVPNTGGRVLNPSMGSGTLDNDQYQARFVGKVALGDLDLSADEDRVVRGQPERPPRLSLRDGNRPPHRQLRPWRRGRGMVR
ncbi:MAG: hypothetical protein IPJ58_15755 [Ardenticatenia bacterium]|nr:hypothetical protein [Ardenticatenia bacterium]